MQSLCFERRVSHMKKVDFIHRDLLTKNELSAHTEFSRRIIQYLVDTDRLRKPLF